MRGLPRYGAGGIGAPGLRWMLPQAGQDYERMAWPVHLNGMVAIGVSFLGDLFLEAPLVVQRRTADRNWQTVEGHPLEALVARGNDGMDGSALWRAVVLSYKVSGNAYLFIWPKRNGEPHELIYLPDHLVEPRADRENPNGLKLISHYRYTPPGGEPIDLPPELVVHLRMGVDPQNPMRGLSPLAAQMREICADNAAGSYTAGLLSNFGLPTVAFSPKDNKAISPEQIQQFREKFEQRFRNEGAGRAGVIPTPVEVHQIGFSPEEMALSDMRTGPANRICAALGFDPMAIGLPSENKTYANYKEAREAAFENGILPMKSSIAQQMTVQLLAGRPGYGLGRDHRIWWDFSEVRALQEDVDRLWSRVTKAWRSDLITRAEARRALGRVPERGEDEVYFSEVGGSSIP